MNVRVRNIIPTGLILILLLTAGCGGGDTTPPPPQATLTSISISPADPSIAPGTTQQFTATANYSNGYHALVTSSATWTSSNSAVADAGPNGLATATTTTGSTIISAAYGGISGAATLTVSPVASLAVTPPNPPSIAPGTTNQFTATGTLADSAVQILTNWATWSSSDEAVVTVDDPVAKGMAHAVAPGTATITASYSGASGTAAFKSSSLVSMGVTPTTTSIPKGTTFQFEALGTLIDATQTLTTVATWSTSSSGVATISNAAGSKGRATAVSIGTTTILSSFTSVTSSPARLTVTDAILTAVTVTPVNPSIASGKTKQFAAMGTFTDSSVQDLTSSVDWSSTNENVATISNTAGTKGLAASNNTGITGTTTIRATSGSISNSTTLRVTQVVLESISVTPNPATGTRGGANIQFTATGNYTNGTTQNLTASVVWNSSDASVAYFAVGHTGLVVTTVNGGTTLITATMSGITSDAAVLTVL